MTNMVDAMYNGGGDGININNNMYNQGNNFNNYPGKK